MLKRLLQRLAYSIIQKTNDPDRPQVIFTHTACGSQSVVPLVRYFSSWKQPAFECLKCDKIITENVSAALIFRQERPQERSDGLITAYEIHLV